MAVSAVLMSGCSVYENVKTKFSNKSTTTSGAQAVEVKKSEKVDNAAKETAEGRSADTNRQMRPVVVHPQIMVQDPDTTITVTKTEPEKTELSKLQQVVGGSWTIIKIGDKVIDRDEDMPYIVFEPGENRFYANNGCNTLNGGYTIYGDNVTFHNVLTTLRYCEDVDFDHEINVIISDETETELAVSEDGNQTILDFVTSTGKVLMRCRRGNLEFLNGQWDIVKVGALSDLAAPATVFFDLTDMKLHGNTGCNFINGEIYLDHRKPNAVDFSNIITTLRACQWPEQQTAILVALEETEAVISDGTDKADLIGANGEILLQLKKAKQ